MTAIETLSSIIAQRGKASKSFYHGHAGFDLLAQTGFIRDSGLVQSVPCDACDDPHDAELVFEHDTYGYHCPDVGFVGLTVLSSRAIQPDIGKLVADLADAFDCKKRKSTPVKDETWRIGALETPAGDLALYFHPRLETEHDAHAVEAALLQETRAVFRLIISAVGTLSAPNAKGVQLSEIVEFGGDSGKLASLTDLRTVVGAPQEPSNGRPSPYAVKLSRLILGRIEEGSAIAGRNAEAREIGDIYTAKYPTEKAPSVSTIKRHMTNLLGGS